MLFCKTKSMKKIERKIEDKNWKANSQSYLRELQLFLDKAENIQNEELKKEIIYQMLKCDRELTNLAEEMFEKYYIQGKKGILSNAEKEDDD